MPSSVDARRSLITQAVAVLRRGGLVAFPTETVYGLGADASNPEAVAHVYAVKGRPASHPVIVHIGAVEQLARWASDVPEPAAKLAARFWPGPLTLVLRRAAGVRDDLTGGQATIGLRIPAHPLALELLREFGGGIAAPSANRFGRISPTTADHVLADLGSDVDMILDGGPCEVGVESTIVDVSRDRVVVLRPGRVSEEDIAATLGVAPQEHDAGAPRAPGTLHSHYAPQRPLRLVPSREWDVRARGESTARGVMSFRARPEGDASRVWIQASSDPQRYAHDLYANLRALDSSGCAEILVEEPPTTGKWTAIRDRLMRARSG